VSRSDEDRLLDIVAAIEAIGRHVERGSLDDGLIFDAVRARLMEIGEAVKDVDSKLLVQQPAIPWRRIAAMRDQLAHRYFDTSHAIVASTVTNDLVELRVAVETLINSLQQALQAEKSGHGGLPETDLARVRCWCRDRVPDHLRDQVRVEVDVDARHLTLFECRPPWDGQGDWTRLPVARLRFTKATGLWTLYWRDRNERFHLYDRIGASENLQVVLEEIDRDPTAIFWG
jgi:uncharacterized protein with HEPN domain